MKRLLVAAMLLTTVALASPPVPRNAKEFIDWYVNALQPTLDAGNLRRTYELLEALERAGAFASPTERQELSHAIAIARLLAGEEQLAREQGEKLWREASAATREVLTPALLLAAQRGALSEVSRAFLPRYASLAEKPAERFLLRTFTAASDPAADLLRAAAPALAELEQVQSVDPRTLDPLFLNEAIDFWTRALEQRSPAGDQQLARLFQLARNLQLQEPVGHYAFGLGNALRSVDAYLQAVRDGKKERAERWSRALPLAETYAATLAEEFAATDQAYPGYDLRLEQGRLGLLQARLKAARALNASGAEAERLWREAEALQAVATSSHGYPGLRDVRWWQAERLPPEQALAVYDRLLEENRRLVFAPGIVEALLGRGRALLNSRRDAEAAAALTEGLKRAEEQALLTGQVAPQRPEYALLAHLQLQAGAPGQALQTLDRQAQLQTLGRAAPELAKLEPLRNVGELRAQNAALQTEITESKALGRSSQTAEELLARNKADFHRVLSDLRRTEPQYEAALAIRPVNLSQLQKYLPADTALLQYFPAREGLYLFVVTARDLRIRKVAVTEQQLQHQVRSLRLRLNEAALQPELLRNFRWDDSTSSWAQRHTVPLRRALVQLQRWLLEPAEVDLQGVKVLAFIPTGMLHYVPFPALARERDGGLQFTAERFRCVNLVKSADLTLLASSPKRPAARLFALGNPDGSLPGAEKEVNAISLLFPHAEKVLGSAATEQRLRSLPPATSFVHLATHGELDARDPKKSYLVLAGSHFEVADVYGLNLDGVRLVTLSACQTALESGSPGSEVTNLAEAFSVAGSQSVVASLWSVSDQSTERLMRAFYSGLRQGVPPGQALQQAELLLLRDPRLCHPFYWAAFTLFGDWR